jgi:hypothetical protein
MDDVEEILRREASLNTTEVRAAPDVVLAILDEKFVEIDSDGRVWDAEGVAGALAGNPEPHSGGMENVRVLRVSDDVYLLIYSSARGDATIWHSSVWVRADDQWRVVFHQQTRVAAVPLL